LSSGEIERFELFEADASLPRILYIAGANTSWHAPHSGFSYYGLPIRESLPTLVHPNEFLDGAITKDARPRQGAAGDDVGMDDLSLIEIDDPFSPSV
jgi:hypothetical protein